MAGAITAVLYWLSNPIWLGGTLAATAIAALDALWGTKIGGNTGLSIIVGLAFIWVAVTMNILSLRSMKGVPNLGAIVKLALFGGFAVLVLLSGAQRRPDHECQRLRRRLPDRRERCARRNQRQRSERHRGRGRRLRPAVQRD